MPLEALILLTELNRKGIDNRKLVCAVLLSKTKQLGKCSLCHAVNVVFWPRLGIHS